MNKGERAAAEQIAGTVRRLRKERGWSQLALAEHAGVSLNYVSLLERAERLPSVNVMARNGGRPAVGGSVPTLTGRSSRGGANPPHRARRKRSAVRPLVCSAIVKSDVMTPPAPSAGCGRPERFQARAFPERAR